MEILGIGPLELFFILLIALIVLGPKDMAKAGSTIGRFLRKVVTSPAWKTFQQTTKELKNLPTELMRQAGVEEELAQFQKDLPKSLDINNEINKNFNINGTLTPPDTAEPENKILPPSAEKFSDWTTPQK